ncbi:MAG: hypothetical protein NWE90_01825 [Candidatus Bathyarchaeota archaeon]|nr:hypothetical protein [Candidatus Bathyarchaeota archaeon]
MFIDHVPYMQLIVTSVTLAFVLYGLYRSYWKGPDLRIGIDRIEISEIRNEMPVVYDLRFHVVNSGSRAGTVREFRLSYVLTPPNDKLSIRFHNHYDSNIDVEKDSLFRGMLKFDFQPQDETSIFYISELETAKVTIRFKKTVPHGILRKTKFVEDYMETTLPRRRT